MAPLDAFDQAIVFSTKILGYEVKDYRKQHQDESNIAIEFKPHKDGDECIAKFIKQIEFFAFRFINIKMLSKYGFMATVVKCMFGPKPLQRYTFYCVRCKKDIEYYK